MNDNEVSLLVKDLRSKFHNLGEKLQLLNESLNKVEQRMARMEQTLETGIGQNHREDQQLTQAVRRLIRKSRLKLSEP